LMLASYQWSTGRSERARHLLLAAISISRCLGPHGGYASYSQCFSKTVDLAFEADSMGLSYNFSNRREQLLDGKFQEGCARQMSWTCFLMDTQFSLGEHRARFIRDTVNFFPGNRADFNARPQSEALPNDALQIDVAMMKTSRVSNQGFRSTMCSLTSSSTNHESIPLQSKGSQLGDFCPNTSDYMILCYYTSFVSLLHQIHTRARSRPSRSVCYDSLAVEYGSLTNIEPRSIHLGLEHPAGTFCYENC